MLKHIAAALLMIAGCTISPPENVFRCPDGECPAGQVCDVDRICRTQPLAALPDASLPTRPDTGVPVREDSGTSPAKLCEGGCSGDKPICANGMCVACEPDTRSCEGDTPVLCSATGEKQRQDPCGGDKPVCNNGVCGALRLRGGLGAAGPLLKSSDGVRLVEHTLTRAGEQCADIQGKRICLRGGIEP